MHLLALSLCFIMLISKLTACPQDSCETGTCCPLNEFGDFSCCPLEDATCCSDGVHCCPKGTTCDAVHGGCTYRMTATVPHGTAVEGHQEQPEREVIHDIKAEDSHSEKDKIHLHEEEGVDHKEHDIQVSHEEHHEEKLEEQFEEHVESSNVICSENFYCPKGYTCCERPDGTYGCCPYKNGVCCPDHKHCCPENNYCDVSSEYCLSNNVHSPFRIRKREVV